MDPDSPFNYGRLFPIIFMYLFFRSVEAQLSAAVTDIFRALHSGNPRAFHREIRFLLWANLGSRHRCTYKLLPTISLIIRIHLSSD